MTIPAEARTFQTEKSSASSRPPDMVRGESHFTVTGKTPDLSFFQGEGGSPGGFASQGMACPLGKTVTLQAILGGGNGPAEGRNGCFFLPVRGESTGSQEGSRENEAESFPEHRAILLARVRSEGFGSFPAPGEKDPSPAVPW